MKNKDFIKMLSKFDPEAEVFIFNDEHEEDIPVCRDYIMISDDGDEIYIDCTGYMPNITPGDKKGERLLKILKNLP